MASLSWLDEVISQLTGRGLPAAYVERFVMELSDHLEDLTEENMSTDSELLSRLGHPEQVAEAAAVAYRRRGYLGRHPAVAFLVFAISPVVSMALLIALGGVALVAIGMVCRWFGVNTEFTPDQVGIGVARSLCLATTVVTIVIPSLLASVLYCELAARLGMGRKWMIVSAAVLAVMCSLCSSWMTLSNIPGKSVWTFGIGFPPHALQFVQLLVPLAVVGWFLWRRTREQQRPMQLAS
jgi:hypothetical protein